MQSDCGNHSFLSFIFDSFSKTAAGEEESYFWLLLRVLNYANAKDVYLVITITRSYCFWVICHKGGSTQVLTFKIAFLRIFGDPLDFEIEKKNSYIILLMANT